tara:strand:+ start:27 stop:719 length:693 start_codon:yes stop_codon:yes gene_type:complete
MIRDNKKVLAVITARGGSKRLLNKNMINLLEKPLIEWTISAAKEITFIDKLIVSTDSDEIKTLAISNGIEVPFIRPKELSDDTATSYSVLKHALDFYKKGFDFIMLLQPSSPLRVAEDIKGAVELISDDVSAVVSVCKAEHPPLWVNTLPKDNSMKDFIREDIKDKRSQDIAQYYRINGAVYISEVDYFINQKGFLGNLTKAFIMPRNRSVDIDTITDLKFAEVLLMNKL